MRATSIQRFVTRAATYLVPSILVLATAVPVVAAVPLATAGNQALPPVVTGDIVAFRATLHYQDPSSTLAKAYVTIFTDTGTGALEFVSATKNGSVVANACGTTLPVSCTFKTVRPEDRLAVTVAYDRVATTATASGIWSSTGAPTSDIGDNSHGDTWRATPATATFQAAGGDYGGGFSTANGGSVANGQAVDSVNRQATKVAALPAGVAATVLDGAGATGDCGDGTVVDCSTTFGEWSEVTVGDGQTFGVPFQIVITYYQGTPKGFVHKYVDAAGVTQYESIGACPKKNPADSAPCFVWSAKFGQATIFSKHNGSFKGL
jgi:hypothetical protein